MGFSCDLVDRAFEENGDADENLILEVLFRYSRSSPNASVSLDGFSSSDMEEENSPIEFAFDDKQEIKEMSGPLNDDLDKRSYLATMNFSEEEIDSAITRLGDNAPLPELVDFIVTAQTTGCFGDEEVNGSANGDHGNNEVMNKSRALLQMGFTENEVSSAIDNFDRKPPGVGRGRGRGREEGGGRPAKGMGRGQDNGGSKGMGGGRGRGGPSGKGSSGRGGGRGRG